MADRTPIIVATIGLIGTITVGLLANADKLPAMFGRSASRGDADGATAASPPPGNTIAAKTGPDDATQAKRGDDGTPAKPETNATDPIVAPPPPPAKPAQVAGLWTSSDGYSFSFSQSGSSFSYTAKQQGVDKGSGNGTIDGDALSYGFTSPDGDGACTATLAQDRNSMLGSCHMNDQAWKTWPVEIKRFVRLQLGPNPALLTIMKHRSP